MPESHADNKAVSALAATLLDARRNGPIAPVADALAPRDQDAAYRVQQIVGSRLGPVAGWKVGAPTRETTPFYAPLPAGGFQPAGQTLPVDFCRLWVLEGELMFRLARDLPPRETPYIRDEVLGAVSEVSAGFEIVDSRYSAWPTVPPLLNLADHAAHAGMVVGVGKPVPAIDFAQVPVRLTIDGREVVYKTGGNSAGDPVRLFVWLANRLAEIGGGLRAGDLVTTGSCTGVEPLAPGSSATVAFDGFEPVTVKRAAA